MIMCFQMFTFSFLFQLCPYTKDTEDDAATAAWPNPEAKQSSGVKLGSDVIAVVSWKDGRAPCPLAHRIPVYRYTLKQMRSMGLTSSRCCPGKMMGLPAG